MAQKQSDDCIVAVTIEMGHHANFRKEPSAEGFTHDWTVFVRGFEGSRLENFVEKVVFKLHNTFKNPVRVKNEPPFRVTESGYAGFTLPIEIHFKNKQTPRKIVFPYNLFLNAVDRPPVININCEKLKFKNPTAEFKALLIKAGGIELSSEELSGDLLGSVRSQNRAIRNIPNDKENDKEKVKKNKNKKKSKQLKSTSPTPSLSSLSPMSSDNEDSYTAPTPHPPVKKEKELSVKKQISSPLKQDSSSSHKDKLKHRSTSSTSSYKERLDKDASHKSQKHKDKTKERDRSSSHKDKDVVKKDRDANSQKVFEENFEVKKEREGSHSSGKSSKSPSQLDNKIAVQVSHKEREKSLPRKDKETLGPSKEKIQSSSKDREKLPKIKHSPHKDVSFASHSEPKKVAEEISKEKVSKEIHRHHKSHVESAEKVELKRSSSVVSTDEKTLEAESSSKKEKHISRDSKKKESSQEVEESKSSYSDKRKHKKNHHSKKQRQDHSSEAEKKCTEKLSEISQKRETPMHADRLGLSANPQLQLLSPLKSKSDEEESPTEQKDLKSILNKQSEQTTSSQKIASNESAEEKQQKKVEHMHSKYGGKKFRKAVKKKTSLTEHSDVTEHSDDQQVCGLDMLAPNGMSIRELIAINEQIAKAQRSSNRKLLEKVVRIIGETDGFDISDVSLSFDICSVDKAVVQKIQALFRER